MSVLISLWAANGIVANSQTRPRSPRPQDRAPVSAHGKQTFASTCAGCHGLDGRGGERAPNIAQNAKVQRLSDAQIAHIIENGIPGTGMPPARSLGDFDVKAVVTYLRNLQGTKETVMLPGDPTRGESLFFAKGECSSCHMVGGKGGFIASDLSSYARTHDVDEARSAISNAAPSSNRQSRLVTATIRSGEKYAGRIRNEDNFSLQLQALDGTFHFLSKSEIETLEYTSQPLMPSDYGSKLSAGELNDLVSYLMNVASASGPGASTKSEDEE